MSDERFVEVAGYGSATTTPDRLRAYVGAESSAATIAQAFREGDEAMANILAALREHGTANEDLRTTGVELYSVHERRAARRMFRASFTVEAVLRDISAGAGALSAAVEAGGDASRVHGVSLEPATSVEPLTQARDAAWADATAKAQQYAARAGCSLGAVLRVTELPARPDGPVRMSLAAESASEFSGSIEPGQRTVHTAISVRWELEDG